MADQSRGWAVWPTATATVHVADGDAGGREASVCRGTVVHGDPAGQCSNLGSRAVGYGGGQFRHVCDRCGAFDDLNLECQPSIRGRRRTTLLRIRREPVGQWPRNPGTGRPAASVRPPMGIRRRHRRRLRLLGAQLSSATHPTPTSSSSSAGGGGGAARAMIGGAPVRNTPLTPSQIEAYTRDGALLVSGLIPPELCRAAEESMWEQMSAAPRPLAEDRWARDGRPRPRRDDRSTWPVGARNLLARPVP